MNNSQVLEYVNGIKAEINSGNTSSALNMALSTESPDFGHFYSLECDFCQQIVKLAYEFNIIEQFLRYSMKCFSKNLVKYLPKSYFSEWRKSFYNLLVDPKLNDSEYPSIPVVPNYEPFINIKYKFNKETFYADEPITISFSFDSYISEPMQEISIKILLASENNPNEEIFVLENVDFQPLGRLTKTITIDPHPRASKLQIKEIFFIMDKFIFKYPQKNNPSVEIEPYESYVDVQIDQPPKGIVDIPIPIKIKYKSGTSFDYNLIFVWSFKESSRDFQISSSPTMKTQVNPSIEIKAPNTEYEKIIYITAKNQISTIMEFDFRVSKSNNPTKFKKFIDICALLPFKNSIKIYNSFRNKIDGNLTTNEEYKVWAKFKYLLPWKCSIESVLIHPIKEQGESFQIGEFNSTFPISIEQKEKFAGNFSMIFDNPLEDKMIGFIDISYKIENLDFPDLLHFSLMLPKATVVSREIEVKTDFPLQTSQYIETEFSIEITSHAKTPLDLFMLVGESKNFFIKGPNLLPISLLPGEEEIIEFSFYAINHGLLYFPKIFIAENIGQRCVWEIEPSLFVSN
ncbi:hypothetical protein TVAG_340340 [Trichomonas vaginalis G3]|uniref:Trafficking protein particle complex subunit 11 C-terminal domain-containing protein n=1 Tax=Trichomonas vaginalis (strain ATCC PRA-98 / G3) TaxID=412133 RepID=A2EKE8_TRIV3|nr:foie gras family [Trichomonas vaginalis G3]EAY06856.1 hypothetical protein TVAG_340340 [Trichomonas vaginalis G3]KAI5489204.1 foie gras family [Trichomonas vaginalis G3]|eukprot:XP_001319079.1 hypothetical protein [Trichomonas vaginalis G3]